MRRMAAVALAAIFVLAGCAPADPLAQQYGGGTGQGYISGDGVVREIAKADRGPAVSFSGITDTGVELTSSSLLGQVVVVNFWYADCPPCRAEARDLEELHQKHLDAGVAFVGVNVRDQEATSRAFARTFGVTYPSLLDAQDARVRLAFAGNVPPSAVPTTLVLDRDGQVAARILGQVTSPSILDTIIRDVVAEAAS